MEEEDYRKRKDVMCKTMENCVHCPFGAYAAEHDIHVCGAFCEAIEFKNFDKAAEIVENWERNH